MAGPAAASCPRCSLLGPLQSALCLEAIHHVMLHRLKGGRDAQRVSGHWLLMSSLCRGRTLWLIGDSHTYDLFHSVACLMLDFWDYAFQGSFPTNGEEQAFEAMAQHVVHSKPPECLPLLEGTMVCHFRVNHGQVTPHQGSLFDSAEVICVSPYMHACCRAPKYTYGIAQTLLILSVFPLFPEACCMRTSSRQLAAKQARNLICHILL